MNILKHEFLYIAYADDTTFFLKERKSITKLMNELNIFLKFSRLKPNKAKCEISGIGVLNGVQVALGSMKCVNLNNKTLNILGVRLSYNKHLERDKTFANILSK